MTESTTKLTTIVDDKTNSFVLKDQAGYSATIRDTAGQIVLPTAKGKSAEFRKGTAPEFRNPTDNDELTATVRGPGGKEICTVPLNENRDGTSLAYAAAGMASAGIEVLKDLGKTLQGAGVNETGSTKRISAEITAPSSTLPNLCVKNTQGQGL